MNSKKTNELIYHWTFETITLFLSRIENYTCGFKKSERFFSSMCEHGVVNKRPHTKGPPIVVLCVFYR
jgi:hypothetical protein